MTGQYALVHNAKLQGQQVENLGVYKTQTVHLFEQWGYCTVIAINSNSLGPHERTVNDNLLLINISTPPLCLFLSCLTIEYVPGYVQLTIKNAVVNPSLYIQHKQYLVNW